MFLVYYEHAFVYWDVFAVRISFSMYLLSILNTLSTFICYQFCIESRRSHQRCSLKLRNIFRKTPVLGSLFNKVVGLQDCKYIKKRLQHRCFVRNLRKFLRKPLKPSVNVCFSRSLLGWVKVKKIAEIVAKARSSHPRCSMKKAFLKYFAIFTGKHLCWSLLIKFINYKL